MTVSKSRQLLALIEKSARGFEGTVLAMKKHHGDEIENPWALSHWMSSRQYKSHYTKTGKKKKRKDG